MIRVSGLAFSYGKTEVFRDLSLEIPKGAFLLLEGDSGSGKTTLLRLIAGLERPSAGRIFLAGEEVSSPKNCRAPHLRNIGMVFQTPALYPNLSVGDNIGFALEQPDSDRITEVLEMVELEDFAGRMPAELSGGQAHRVALARALAPEPGILLLDEALSHLPEALRGRMQSLIDTFAATTACTVIEVTHDSRTESRGRRRVRLHNGRLDPQLLSSGMEEAGSH